MQNPEIIKLLEKRVEMMCKTHELKQLIKEKIAEEQIKVLCRNKKPLSD